MPSGSPPCPDCPYGRVRSSLLDRMVVAWASSENVKWARQRDGRGWFFLCQQCHLCEWLGDRRSNNASSRPGATWPSQRQTADGRTFWLTGTVPEATVKLFRGEALPRALARRRRSRPGGVRRRGAGRRVHGQGKTAAPVRLFPCHVRKRRPAGVDVLGFP